MTTALDILNTANGSLSTMPDDILYHIASFMRQKDLEKYEYALSADFLLDQEFYRAKAEDALLDEEDAYYFGSDDGYDDDFSAEFPDDSDRYTECYGKEFTVDRRLWHERERE